MGLFDFKKKPAATTVPQQAATPPVQQTTNAKILVVDDEEYLLEFYHEILTKRGYQVLTAANGQEALNQVTAQRPDLILLDIMMPLMDGNEVLRQLKDNPQTKDIPVIVLTNAGNLENMDKAKFYSAYKFFIKSNVPPEEIISTVEEALASRSPQAGENTVTEVE
jgi:CheY-like chemotaxis protein